jgi:molybdopterin-guanine dinucleotide biosynthesis protein A
MNAWREPLTNRPGSTGIILAGGASSRMGHDKASAEIGQHTSLRHVVEAVKLVSDDVIIASGRNSQPSGIEEVRYVDDPPGTAGPLAGVVAGMRAAANDTCLVVACDMPFADPGLLRQLLDSLEGCLAVVPIFEGKPQPLQAAYSRECLTVAEYLLRLGDSSVRSLVERVPSRYVTVDRNNGRGLSGFNMNTAADLDSAREHWARRQCSGTGP